MEETVRLETYTDGSRKALTITSGREMVAQATWGKPCALTPAKDPRSLKTFFRGKVVEGWDRVDLGDDDMARGFILLAKSEQ